MEPTSSIQSGEPWRVRVQTWTEVFASPERRIELVAGMTLLLLLLYSEPVWYLEVGVYGLSISALLHRPLLRKPWFWLLLALFLAAGHARIWFQVDNHKYLITYWCLAFGLSMAAADPLRALRTNARLLIGLAFLFAVVAKLLSPDYMSGDFFDSLLVMDNRFSTVTSFLGGIPAQDLQLGRLLRTDLLIFGDLTVPIDVVDSPRLQLMTQVLTWWTLFIEAIVAVLFLWPQDRGPSRWRDLALVLFILTTYPVAPVIGFAWVLAAMGTAQSTTPRAGFGPVLYVAAYIFTMLISYVPLAGLLSS